MAGTMSFDAYVDYMKKGIVHPILKLEMLRFEDESVYSSFVCSPLSGSISVNAVSGGIRRSCNIVLPNFDKLFIPNSNDIDKLWINTKFMVYMGVMNDTTQETIFFPQGEYTLFNSDPEVISDYSNKTVNLKADDKWSVLETPIGQIFQRQPSAELASTIYDVLAMVGDKKAPIIEYVAVTSPNTLRWNATDTYGKVLKDLANLHSMECFYDATGHLVFQSFKDVSVLNNVWEFTTDEVQYGGTSRIYKFSEIVNDVVVIGGTIDTTTFKAEAKNDDLTSDTRISLIGKKGIVIQDEKIFSVEVALDRAISELAKRKRMQEMINLKSSPLFHFDVNEAITIIDSSIDLQRDRYSVQDYQLDVTAHSPMSIQAYKFNDTNEYEDLGIPE